MSLPKVLLLCGLALAAPLLAAPAPLTSTAALSTAPGKHEITCANPRTLRAYQSGLRAFHLGRLDDAAAAFTDAAARDPECAMAFWGLSRTYQKQSKSSEALTFLARAEEHAPNVDDRERKLIAAWGKWLKSAGKPESERKKALEEVRSDLDLLIALYPDDPEPWLLRGDVAETPVRATPFYLGALITQPEHPFGQMWKPIVPPVPNPSPAPTGATASQAAPPQAAPPLFDGIGLLSHSITAANSQAQAYYEQGLRNLHGYTVPERIRGGAEQSFRHATVLDPNCAMAYWGLSFCSSKAMSPGACANRAWELAQKYGSDKERRFCAARVLELSGAAHKEAFLDALEGAIAAYPDDVELWQWRAKFYTGYNWFGGVPLHAIPFNLAAFRINPAHPSPNHEMIHAYEGIDRPALGWPFTEGFRRSAPNLPHANHMQAHLAMRLGRWDDALSDGRAAREKSKAGYPELDVGHHTDVYLHALRHEGRFNEAESEKQAYRDSMTWARLLQIKADPAELESWAARRRQANSPDGFYIGALAALDQNRPNDALPLMAHVEDQYKKNQNANFYRYHEVRGRHLVQTAQVEEGLKLLREAGKRAVKASGLHAWGGGSYVLEVWGEAALRAGRWEEAEEAYHEALAHEHGSILGALGMQVAWEKQGRTDLANHYAARAALIWKNADPGALDRQLARLRSLAGVNAK